jgi:hypothetical protein
MYVPAFKSLLNLKQLGLSHTRKPTLVEVKKAIAHAKKQSKYTDAQIRLFREELVKLVNLRVPDKNGDEAMNEKDEEEALATAVKRWG